MENSRDSQVFSGASTISLNYFKRILNSVLSRCDSLGENFEKQTNHPYKIDEELGRIKYLASLWDNSDVKCLVADIDKNLQEAFETLNDDLSKINKNISEYSYDRGRDSALIDEFRVHLIQLEKANAAAFALVQANEQQKRMRFLEQQVGFLSAESAKHDAIADELRKLVRDSTTEIGSTVSGIVRQIFESTIDQEFLEIKKTFEETMVAASKTVQDLDAASEGVGQIKSKAEGILKDAQEAGLVSSIGRRANEFKTLASTAGRDAIKWLRTGYVLLGVGAVLAFFFAFVSPIDNSDFNSIGVLQRVVPRLILTGGLLVAGTWCLRMFKVFRHQQESYRFKRTVLLSLYRIYNTTDDEELRKAMVLEASKTIFSVGITGLVDTEDETASNQLAEMAKLIQFGIK